MRIAQLMFAAFVVALSGSAIAAQPVQVMVLGTYHFASPGLDLANVKADEVLSAQRQRELGAVAEALAAFKPTKIMTERQVDTANLVDSHYQRFTAVDLSKERDERVQIAYRLARKLGLEAVYGIDEQPAKGEPDYFPFDKLASWAQAHGQQAKVDRFMAGGRSVVERIEQLQRTGSIAEVLLAVNRPETTERDQALYYSALDVGDTDQQPGAELNAYWYLRNAKIFAKLMSVAKPGDRVLVVYGSGHNYWLRHFAKTVPGYQNVDPTNYLSQAATPRAAR